MTNEQEKISDKNKKKAWDYFVSIGQIPKDAKPYQYDLHHINPNWKHDDIERYIQWNPEDLVVLTHSEHSKLHWELDREYKCKRISDAKKGKKHTPEHNQHISDAIRANHPFKGKHHSEESKRKMSESRKGKHWKVVNGKRVWYERKKYATDKSETI